MSDLRRDIDTNHNGWYKDSLTLWRESNGDQPAAAADAQGEQEEPGSGRGGRRACASVYKDNQPASSESDHMKRAVAIPDGGPSCIRAGGPIWAFARDSNSGYAPHPIIFLPPC